MGLLRDRARRAILRPIAKGQPLDRPMLGRHFHRHRTAFAHRIGDQRVPIVAALGHLARRANDQPFLGPCQRHV